MGTTTQVKHVVIYTRHIPYKFILIINSGIPLNVITIADLFGFLNHNKTPLYINNNSLYKQ